MTKTTSQVEYTIIVPKVEYIEASSIVADNSPQQFEGHKTDFGNPCSGGTSPGQALIIFYDDVIDANYQVQDFNVNFDAKIFPDTLSDSQVNESWCKTEGPESGSLNKTNTFSVIYQNPKTGGLYKVEFDFGFTGYPKSGVNILLPLAGADMSAYLNQEAHLIGAWAINHKDATADANLSLQPGVTEYNIYNTWSSLSGAYFDYELDPVDIQQDAPCRRFQLPISDNAQYGYVTINGVVVHASKINNMFWALFGRYWGWPKLLLKTGAHLNQLGKSKHLDGPTSQNAISLADDIYDLLKANPGADISTVMTEAKLRSLVDAVDYDEEKMWPSPNIADNNNSTFIRPTLPTTP